MKIATSIAVAGFTLTLLGRGCDSGARAVSHKDNSLTWPDMRDGKKSPEAFKRAEGSGSTTTYPLEFYDKLLRQRAREDKINALNARCNGNSSALCRKHNDRPAEKSLPLSGRAEALSS